MVNVTLRVQGLNELVGGLGLLPEFMAVENQKAMVLATHVAEAEIKALTPRRTGRLQSAWTPTTLGVGFATVGIVGDVVSYAPFVEEGTGAHDITAHGNALMIPVGSSGFGGGALSGRARAGQQVAFFKKVHHPGTRGRHMASRGLEAARPAIVALFSAAAQRAVQTALGKLRNATSYMVGQL